MSNENDFEIQELTDKLNSQRELFRRLEDTNSKKKDLLNTKQNELHNIKEEIQNNDTKLKDINSKLIYINSNRSLIGVLQNSKSNMPTYQLAKYIEDPTNLHIRAQVRAKQKEISVLDSDKLALMKNISYFYDSLNQTFNINPVNLENYQNTISKLFNQASKEFPDDKIKQNANILIYYIGSLEIQESKKASNGNTNDNNSKNNYNINVILSKNSVLDTYSCGYFTYDHLYVVEHKFYILSIKKLVCKFFNPTDERTVFINQYTEIVPYDMVLYNEVFETNIQRGTVNSIDKFFNMNEEIIKSPDFTYIIIGIEDYLEFIGEDYERIKIYKPKHYNKTYNLFMLKYKEVMIKIEKMKDNKEELLNKEERIETLKKIITEMFSIMPKDEEEDIENMNNDGNVVGDGERNNEGNGEGRNNVILHNNNNIEDNSQIILNVK